MFLAQKQCNIIKWLATNWIATLKKHTVMSPDGFDKVNKLVYDLPNGTLIFSRFKYVSSKWLAREGA